MESITSVDWLAVIVGAVLSFLLGWLWYSPRLFGVKWAEGVGVDLGSAGDMPVKAMAFQALGTFLFAWVVGVTAAANAFSAFLLIVVAIAVLVYAGGLFAKKSEYAAITESGFVISMAIVMFIVQAVL